MAARLTLAMWGCGCVGGPVRAWQALVACTEASEQALRAEQYKMQDKDANVGSLDGSF